MQLDVVWLFDNFEGCGNWEERDLDKNRTRFLEYPCIEWSSLKDMRLPEFKDSKNIHVSK
jgi:hypothetical protein